MRRAAYPAARSAETDLLKDAVPFGCIISEGTVTPALNAVYKGGNAPDNVIFTAYSASKNTYAVATAAGWFVSNDGVNFGMIESYPLDYPFMFEESGEESKTMLAGGGKCAEPCPNGYQIKAFGFGVKCGVIRNGRLFAVDNTDGCKIRWSGTDGAFDWTESANGAGFVYIEPKFGRVLKLVTYKQRVVAVCERGIAYLSAYGIAENFKLVYTDGVTGKIDENSVAVAGNRILFTAGGNVYGYDGIKAEKLNIPLLGDAGETVCAAGRGENYYLAAESKSLKRKVIFVVDAERLTAYTVDVPAEAICAGMKIIAYTGSGAYTLEEGNEYSIVCGKTNFGTRARKTFKGVIYEGGGDITVEVETRGKSRISRGVAGYCPVNIGGCDFITRVRGSAKITGIKAVAEVISGV